MVVIRDLAASIGVIISGCVFFSAYHFLNIIFDNQIYSNTILPINLETAIIDCWMKTHFAIKDTSYIII